MYQSSIAQHTHAIGHRDDFIEVMRDEDHRAPFIAQQTQTREQSRRFAFSQHCGGFIKNQHTRIAGEALGDLNELRLCDGEFTGGAVKIKICSEHREQFARACRLRRAINRHTEPSRALTAEQNVFGNAERRHKIEFLMHHRDACGQRV